MLILIGALGYAAIGVIAGVATGLLGISGGVITVPSLFFLFRLLGYPQELIMQMAIGTSLASMVFNTISSTIAHHKRKAVLWPVVKKMAPGLVIGSLIGALCASYLSAIILEIIFGVFLCIIGLYFFRPTPPSPTPKPLPKPAYMYLISGGIGCLSNILGIGGGIMTVPTLLSFKLPEKSAIGTSAATSVLITTLGAVSYLIFGLGQENIPESIGFLNLPAFAVIGPVTFFAAPFGARLAHRLPNKTLKQILGVALLLIGITMLSRSV